MCTQVFKHMYVHTCTRQTHVKYKYLKIKCHTNKAKIKIKAIHIPMHVEKNYKIEQIIWEEVQIYLHQKSLKSLTDPFYFHHCFDPGLNINVGYLTISAENFLTTLNQRIR